MTLPGMFHTAFGTLALVFGGAIVALPKGRRLHRALGYAYLASMVLLNATAFRIYQFSGNFGPFHVLAVVSLLTLFVGFLPAKFRWPPGRWKESHLITMSWSYIGLWAAFATEITIRLPFVRGVASALWGTVIATTVAMLIGGAFLGRYFKEFQMKRVRVEEGTSGS